jgi:hypothetical protein
VKYWFDTEFHEDGRTIDLISIGVWLRMAGSIMLSRRTSIASWRSIIPGWLRTCCPISRGDCCPPVNRLRWVTAEMEVENGTLEAP